MRTVDIEIGGFVHCLHITYGGTRTRVESTCIHGDAEGVLAVLSGIELHCEWPAEVLQHLLRRRVPFDEACAWARLPLTPHHPHFMLLWKRPDVQRPWSLLDLERWRGEGCTAERAAEFCARYPHRVHWPKGPS
jgi:hypothetical protein